MKFDDIMYAMTEKANGEESPRVAGEILTEILDALSQVYPMILLANLTQNRYVMLKDRGFLYRKNTTYGNYDEMISNGVKNVHPNYQSTFLDTFARSKLIARYENGVRQVSARLYQRGENGEYQWVETKVIRLQDESGDVVQVCLNEILPQ